MYKRTLFQACGLQVQVAGSWPSYGDVVAVAMESDQAFVAWFSGHARGFNSPYVGFVLDAIAGIEADKVHLVEASSLDEFVLRVCDAQIVSQLLDRRVRALVREDTDRARYALVSDHEFRPIRPEFMDWVRQTQSSIAGWARVLRQADEAQAVEAAVKAAEEAIEPTTRPSGPSVPKGRIAPTRKASAAS